MIKLIATDMDGTLLDERGEGGSPASGKTLDPRIKKGFALSLRQGNEIHRMHQLLGPLVKGDPSREPMELGF